MGGFTLHSLLPSLRVKVTSLYQHENRLYVGCINGTIQVYSFEVPNEGGSNVVPALRLLKSHAIGKRAIDQIGVLPQSNQLVVLSDTVVTTHTLPDLAKSGTATLTQARYAHAFAITSYTTSQPKKTKSSKSGAGAAGVEDISETVRRDLLVVGCRKRVLVYGAGKGGIKDGWELTLPHSPRHVIFPSSASPSAPLPETVHLLYSPTTSALLHITPSSSQRLSVSDLPNNPAPPPQGEGNSAAATSPVSPTGDSSGTGGSALSIGMGGMMTGLGGYVGLGGRSSVPVGTKTVGGEVLLARDDLGVFVSSEGNFTRQESLRWPGSPEAIAFANPYIYSVVSILPLSTTSNKDNSPTSTVQIHLAPTLSPIATLTLPNPSTGTIAIGPIAQLHSKTATPASAMSAAAKLLIVSTPNDKTLSQSEGSSVWVVESGDLGEQVDELVRAGRVSDAIGLVEAVGDSGLSPKRRLPHLKTLQAVQQFARGQYQTAIETFLIFNTNPALIISLYPEQTISGRLNVPRSGWMRLFGAVDEALLEPDQPVKNEESSARGLLNKVTGGLTKKGSIETLRTTAKEDDTGSSISGDKISPVPLVDDIVAPRSALEALMYFLSDRRQKLTGAISSLSSPLPAESSLSPLSSLPGKDLHALPSIPMTELDPEQLLRMAQVIYTALIKVYLVARPVLVGSLCRIENWCDVEEVEELLKAQKKFGDLIDLYQGKKMHAKALGMLHELAKDEEDKLDRYPPTIRYLQKLGSSELPLILESSKWVFNENPTMALQIFTADEPEVESLSRKDVTDFLEKTNAESCIGYLEHIINILGEDGADFHDKLAEIYLDKAKAALKNHKDGDRPKEYARLLEFLVSSTQYRPYRLLSKTPDDNMPEARAILLGRVGKHEEALRIYVYRLKDYPAAEIYCARVYSKDPDPHGIFLLLLRIYLRPINSSDPVLLEPALSLIATHGIRLDAPEVLDLLPPLVTMLDVRAFFVKTLRDGHAKKNDSRVIKNLISARKEEVERALMELQVKRVRVSDQRICPQCQKRLGQSAIGVHAPRGEVTHLHCKDSFSAKLAKLRD